MHHDKRRRDAAGADVPFFGMSAPLLFKTGTCITTKGAETHAPPTHAPSIPGPHYQLPHTTYRTVTVMGAEVALG
jgi:hypothetical protein